MFQAVNYANERGALGQHFTSVVNILKVINPLFMDDLRAELEDARGNNKKLKQLLFRLKNIKIFDPACGSGNFLIIAYKELRRLEMEIFKEMGALALSEISLSQFYGIELDEFAKEVAILALWLSKHQMNVEFFREFGRSNPTLPLSDSGNIVQGNACRLQWEDVCPKNENDEIYILGNPPYVGSSMQSKKQKEDMRIIFENLGSYKNLDYISCWMYLASSFIKDSNSAVSFVSTNSICQGEQVNLLWSKIYNLNIEIGFAYQSFKWVNNAKFNAGVTCVIIGLRNISSKPKILFHSGRIAQKVRNINAYLTEGKTIIFQKRADVLSCFPTMVWGNKATDGGNLVLNDNERKIIIEENPDSQKFIKKYIGSQEFIKGIERWCLWIQDKDLDDAMENIEIKKRVLAVRDMRLSSKAASTVRAASFSHKFIQIQNEPDNALVVPTVSSELRYYIPIVFVDNSTVVNASCYAIYNSPLYMFSVLSSRLHVNWVHAVAGRLETRIRYSSALCYNIFPFPNISKQRKEELSQYTLKIIDERSKYSEKTISELYNPEKMPESLKEVHLKNDLAVEMCYRSTPFSSDNERLEYLFNLYEKMIEEEKFQNTLFEKEKKTRKRKTT